MEKVLALVLEVGMSEKTEGAEGGHNYGPGKNSLLIIRSRPDWRVGSVKCGQFR